MPTKSQASQKASANQSRPHAGGAIWSWPWPHSSSSLFSRSRGLNSNHNLSTCKSCAKTQLLGNKTLKPSSVPFSKECHCRQDPPKDFRKSGHRGSSVPTSNCLPCHIISWGKLLASLLPDPKWEWVCVYRSTEVTSKLTMCHYRWTSKPNVHFVFLPDSLRPAVAPAEIVFSRHCSVILKCNKTWLALFDISFL